MNLLQVRRALFQSECRKYIKEGMSLSEPIPSKCDDGIIDNYFLYYEDLEEHIISGPTSAFGINSETRTMVYVKTASECQFPIGIDQEIVVEKNLLDIQKFYEKYYAMYETTREIVFCEDCTKDQKDMLADYYMNFSMMFDKRVLALYKALSPEYFQWLEHMTKGVTLQSERN